MAHRRAPRAAIRYARRSKRGPRSRFPHKPPPFARQKFTVDDLSPYIDDPAERARFRDEILSARNEGLFTPPGPRNTVQMPGNNGGANWGGAAVDPTNGTLYVVSKDLPAMLKLELEKDVTALPQGTPEQQGRAVYEAKCQICHHGDLKGQPPGRPVTGQYRIASHRATGSQRGRTWSGPDARGPGSLARGYGPADCLPVAYGASREHARCGSAEGRARTALSRNCAVPERLRLHDHKHRSLAHQAALDIAHGLRPQRGHHQMEDPSRRSARTRCERDHRYRSALSESGAGRHRWRADLTGTRDRKVRALDSNTGAVLWETQVDAALEGMPAVYSVNGREYIVFCAAAQSATDLLGTPGHPATQGKSQKGAYVAFALPR